MEFSPNAGKSEKNANQNNSEYGHFLRSVWPTQWLEFPYFIFFKVSEATYSDLTGVIQRTKVWFYQIYVGFCIYACNNPSTFNQTINLEIKSH